MSKKLLVLGGAEQHCKVVEAAHKMGVYVYVTDYIEDSPAKRLADQSYCIDVNDTDRLVGICQTEEIDGAIATSLDACQQPYQRVCERMRYPCFGTREQFLLLTDKAAFKKCCKEYGVDTIPAYSEGDVLKRSFNDYPIFIKPSDSRGSRGQTVCYQHEDVLAGLRSAKEFSSSGEIVIEKYMGDKPDFTVSYMIVDGEPIVVRTGDRFEGNRKTELNNLCIASHSPSRYTERFFQSANENIVKMLKGIGLYFAPVFFQGFVDGDRFCLYDPGLRFAGGEYERILKSVYRIDIMELLVKFALGIDYSTFEISDKWVYLDGKVSMQLDPTLCPGTIGKIEGLGAIKKRKNMIYLAQRLFAGDEVSDTYDLGRRLGEFSILCNDAGSEVEEIRFIQNTLKVTDQSNENMLIDPFETYRLMQ